MTNEIAAGCESESGSLIVRLEVTFAADINSISPVVDGMMRLVSQMGYAAGKEHAVETALREALANAIIHGCKNDPGKQVQCCVACDEENGMLIVVRDPGEGFDPVSLPNPIKGQNVYSDHGRGIYLINLLMDEVTYKRGGREIHMRKY